MSTRKSSERDEAIARLREWLKPGDTVYTILRHVSRSGMQREISLRKINDDADTRGSFGGRVWDLDYNAAVVLGDRIGKHDGIVIGGCGMDMGFKLVYTLSRTLFRDGFGCIGEGCPSAEHSNGDRDHTPHLDCRCADCSDCQGTKVVCRECNRCTRCTRHAVGCKGCDQHGFNYEHWHHDGGYALSQRWL